MDDLDFETAPPPARPKTAAVVALLAGVAAVFSYLFVYAMTNALVAADMIKPWARDHDSRPIWFAICFVALIGVFCGIAASARFVAAKNLRQIDEMELE